MARNKLIMVVGTHGVGKSELARRMVASRRDILHISDGELKLAACRKLGYPATVSSVNDYGRAIDESLMLLREKMDQGNVCYEGHLIFDYISLPAHAGANTKRSCFMAANLDSVIPDGALLISAPYDDIVSRRKACRPWDILDKQDYDLESALNRCALYSLAAKGTLVKELENREGCIRQCSAQCIEFLSFVMEGGRTAYLYNTEKVG